jgi:flagellar biosynthetic protein FliR
MGFFANIAQHILSFVGQRIDLDMGFSMATEYNASLASQITVTGSLYTYAVTLIIFVTNFHLFIVQAIIDSFGAIPVGHVAVDTNIVEVMAVYMTDYFLIGFRIALPMYAAILIVDTILGILAKVAPQMNMFAVGIQLKIAVGLIALYFMVRMLPGVAKMIYDEMMKLLSMSAVYLGGG